MAVFQLLCCTTFIFLHVVLADPEFPKFPNDYSARGTLRMSGTIVRFGMVFSKSLKSAKVEMRSFGQKETKYTLENMGAYGAEVSLRSEAGHTECTILEGTAKSPVKYESLFELFKNIKYVGTEKVNGRDMEKWQFHENSVMGYIITYENENGSAPYSISLPGRGTMVFEAFSSTAPQKSAFTFDKKGCKRIVIRHVYQNVLGTLLK